MTKGNEICKETSPPGNKYVYEAVSIDNCPNIA